MIILTVTADDGNKIYIFGLILDGCGKEIVLKLEMDFAHVFILVGCNTKHVFWRHMKTLLGLLLVLTDELIHPCS